MSRRIALNPVVEALESVIGSAKRPVSLHEPWFKGNEWAYVKECLDTGWVSSVGKYVDRFEVDLCKATGSKYAVAAVNGTAALHICLLLCDVKDQDEVLIPALTFAATANAVMYCRAVPHFVDSDELSLGIDAPKLQKYLSEIVEKRDGASWNRKTGRRISAMIPMHTFGHPVDLDPLLQVAKDFGIALIEDAAESLGSQYKGRGTGVFGKVAALSFNGNKILTTGGGGAILTQDESLAKRAKHLTTTAKVPHPWEFYHDPIGYNYRMPNLNAALGCAQLEHLDEYLEKKRALAHRYVQAFDGIPGVRFFTELPYAKSNYWLNALLLDKEVQTQRDELLKLTHEHGILTRPVWTLLNRLPMYTECPKMDLSLAESIEARLVNLPSSAFL